MIKYLNNLGSASYSICAGAAGHQIANPGQYGKYINLKIKKATHTSYTCEISILIRG